MAEADVSVRAFFKPAIEQAEEATEQPAFLLARFEQQGRERRRQRQSVEGRNQHRDGYRHRELIVQAALNARQKGHRQEDRRENQSNRNHRPGDFFHRLQRRVARRHAFFDVMLDGFDDDDGVVNDEADGQHQPEQRQRVDRKSEHREEGERADQRHRHGDHRDQRRSPVL